MVVPPHQQVTEYSSLIPNYSPAPSSVCTSDSGGGSSRHGKLRTVRLHRRLLIGRGTPTFGFSVRGGREHGTGFFVSAVEPGSEAHCQGLRIGDQIVRINGYSVEDAIHREVLHYIQSQNHLELRVRSVGMIPVKDKRTDPLTWRMVEDSRNLLPLEVNANTRMMLCKNEEVGQEIRLILNVAPRTKLGCGICKGPEWKPGVFVQFTKENGLARESGLRPGDQILQCNGVPFIDIAFSDAVDILKSSRQLDLIVKKGAGLDLFPGESSGYNSSASSVNGDQSPSWEDTKRLSVVKEESVELEERLGQLDVNQRIIPVVDRNKDWDQIEEDWEKEDEKNWKSSNMSPGTCRTFVHIGEVESHHEANRDMSELSLASSSGSSVGSGKEQNSNKHQPEGTKRIDGSRLAEIRMVSQQLETTTVVVEVHQSDEGDKCIPKQLVKSPSSSSFASIGSSASSSLSSAISQELQRRSQRRETEGYREEQKRDILKAMGGEKRQQHEQLMDEFKRAHRKMFAHTLVPEKEETSNSHSQPTEERESLKAKQQQEKEVKQNNLPQIQRAEHTSANRNKPPPPPPPPMPPDDRSSVIWKPPSPVPSVSSSLGSPPSCPTPDYDTSSSSSTPSLTIPLRNKNPVQSQNKPRPVSSVFPTPTQSSKTKSSNTSPSNASHNKVSDSVEMESLESYTLTNPQSPKPKPPPTYFVPVRSKNSSENGVIKQKRPVSVTIGEYPSNVERRVPTRFDFLTTQAAEGASNAKSSSISCQLQSELAQTLSRSNLRKQTEVQDSRHRNSQNETTSSKTGTVIISVNSEPMIKDSTISTNGNTLQPPSCDKVNMMRINSNNTSSTKISLTSNERSNHVSGTVKPAIRSAAEKIANSLAMNNHLPINTASNKPSSNETESLKTSEYNDFEDIVLVESPFVETTREGRGLRQIQIAITRTKLIMAMDIIQPATNLNVWFMGIDPEIDSLELISMLPIECVKLTVFHHHKRHTLKAHFCNNSKKYFELGGTHNKEILWKLWYEQVKVLSSLYSHSSNSETTAASSSSNNTLYIATTHIRMLEKGRHQLWCYYDTKKLNNSLANQSRNVLSYHSGAVHRKSGLSLTEVKTLYRNSKTRSFSTSNSSLGNLCRNADEEHFQIVNRFGQGIPENCLGNLCLPKPNQSTERKQRNETERMVEMTPYVLEEKLLEDAVAIWEHKSNEKHKTSRHPRQYGFCPQALFLHGLGPWNVSPGERSLLQAKRAMSVVRIWRQPVDEDIRLPILRRHLKASLSCDTLTNVNLNHKRFHYKNKLHSPHFPIIYFWTPEYWYRPKTASMAYMELHKHLTQVKYFLEQSNKKMTHSDNAGSKRLAVSKNATMGRILSFRQQEKVGCNGYVSCSVLQVNERQNSNIMRHILTKKREKKKKWKAKICKHESAHSSLDQLRKILKRDLIMAAWDFDSATLAYQITMIDRDLFLKIPASELHIVLWQQSSKNAVNIAALIAFAHRISCLVATEILQEHLLKARARLIARFISTADKCNSLNNAQSCCSILAGLQSPGVYRLHTTWTYLRQRHASKYHIFEQLCHQYQNPCFQSYQFVFMKAAADSAYLPFIGDILAHLFDHFQETSEQRRSVTVTNMKDIEDLWSQRKEVNENISSKQYPRSSVPQSLLSALYFWTRADRRNGTSETPSISSISAKNSNGSLQWSHFQRESNSLISKECHEKEKCYYGRKCLACSDSILRNYDSLFIPLESNEDLKIQRLKEVTTLLQRCQQAAASYSFCQNELAQDFLLKAHYKEEKYNFYSSFKLE